MRPQRWSTIVSVVVFALALKAAGTAQAQWGYPGFSGYPSFGQFGPSSGFAPGVSVFDSGYGSFGATGFGAPSNFIGFPQPGYSQATGQWPQTKVSFSSAGDAVTLLPGWHGSGVTRRVRRRH